MVKQKITLAPDDAKIKGKMRIHYEEVKLDFLRAATIVVRV